MLGINNLTSHNAETNNIKSKFLINNDRYYNLNLNYGIFTRI